MWEIILIGINSPSLMSARRAMTSSRPGSGGRFQPGKETVVVVEAEAFLTQN